MLEREVLEPAGFIVAEATARSGGDVITAVEGSGAKGVAWLSPGPVVRLRRGAAAQLRDALLRAGDDGRAGGWLRNLGG